MNERIWPAVGNWTLSLRKPRNQHDRHLEPDDTAKLPSPPAEAARRDVGTAAVCRGSCAVGNRLRQLAGAVQQYLPGKYEIEIVDLLQKPQLARGDRGHPYSGTSFRNQSVRSWATYPAPRRPWWVCSFVPDLVI